MGGYRPGQVVDPSGWRWKKLLLDNGWLAQHDGPAYRAADGTEWTTEAKAGRRDERGPEATPEPTEGPPDYEFTPAAEAVILGAGFDLSDYDGDATGATGNVLKSDAEAWLADND
jgi:hypothetical protein